MHVHGASSARSHIGLGMKMVGVAFRQVAAPCFSVVFSRLSMLLSRLPGTASPPEVSPSVAFPGRKPHAELDGAAGRRDEAVGVGGEIARHHREQVEIGRAHV